MCLSCIQSLLKTPQKTPKGILKQPGSECKRHRVLLVSPEKDSVDEPIVTVQSPDSRVRAAPVPTMPVPIHVDLDEDDDDDDSEATVQQMLSATTTPRAISNARTPRVRGSISRVCFLSFGCAISPSWRCLV